jgi:hypothetical protein
LCGLGRPRRPADLADPGDQALTLAHGSPPTRPLGIGRTRRVLAAFLVGHLPDYQRTVLDLLLHQIELLLMLLFRSLTRRLRGRAILCGHPLSFLACTGQRVAIKGVLPESATPASRYSLS